MAFSKWKIWFTHVMASLCRRPKMITTLQSILHRVHAVSYSQGYEKESEQKYNEEMFYGLLLMN